MACSSGELVIVGPAPLKSRKRIRNCEIKKLRGDFSFEEIAPAFRFFEDPVRPPGSQPLAASKRLVFASGARTSHVFRHHIRCESFLDSIPKHPVSCVRRKSRCRFSRWPLSTLSCWRIAPPLIRKILAISLKIIGYYSNIFVEIVPALWK